MPKYTFLPAVLKFHRDLLLCAEMNRRVQTEPAKAAAIK